jgi:hypothetical protein
MSIGGTTGTGQNALSLNLGGVDLNYDLGPSVSTVFQQGLSFLGSRFNADQAFTGQTIFGANNFISSLTTPLLQGATDQLKENATVIPELYGQMENNNYNLGLAAIQTEGDVAQASIASSNESAQTAANAGGGGGGFCYVTTAVCETLGLPDDCHTLRTLRQFRDTYLLRTNVGRAFVEEYYATAPALVSKLRARSDAKEYTANLYTRFILPALLAIEHGAKSRAFKIYREMIYAVRRENV